MSEVLPALRLQGARAVRVRPLRRAVVAAISDTHPCEPLQIQRSVMREQQSAYDTGAGLASQTMAISG